MWSEWEEEKGGVWSEGVEEERWNGVWSDQGEGECKDSEGGGCFAESRGLLAEAGGRG